MRALWMTTLGVAAGVAMLGSAVRADAAVTITQSVCASCENVHLVPGGDLTDNFAEGDVVSGTVDVLFTGIEPIKTGTGHGLPWVTGVDGDLTYLDVSVEPGNSFTLAGFNLNDLPGNGDWFVKISAYDGATLKASSVFTESHNVKFKIAADGTDQLTHFQIQLVTNAAGTTNVSNTGRTQLDGVGQIRIDGVNGASAAPEPATWALMILGFGGAGAMMRRRRMSVA